MLILSLSHPAIGQQITRIDPPGWFVGMQHTEVELLLSGTDLSCDGLSVGGQGVTLLGCEAAPLNGYLYATLRIEQTAAPQTVEIRCGRKKTGRYQFELKARNRYLQSARQPLVDQRDVIYLISPDRFANGNLKNDSSEELNETEVNRTEPFARHGGDLSGIAGKLNYMEDLGVTAIWPCPVVENNQPRASYHGYAITDHYRIDPRFGTLEEYVSLADSLHQRGMKLIKDVVYNHFGDRHYLYQSPPDSAFFNFWPNYTQTNYRASSVHDPHAAPSDLRKMTDGWFDHHMPDVNQRNEHVARYLIQNTLWWIETAGLDALRIDTYAYPDQDFMHQLNAAVRHEYPGYLLFGEVWEHRTATQGFYAFPQNGAKTAEELPAVLDFMLYNGLNSTMTETTDWTKGLASIYYTLSADYLYPHPEQLVTFLDNHDLARSFGYANENIDRWKQALAILLTTRGIPSLYYGTEILMKETANHGVIRQDFPGGWPGDSENKFVSSGRTASEEEAFQFIQSLLQFRKAHPEIFSGKLIQYIPLDGTYAYYRQGAGQEVVLVLLNGSDKEKTVTLSDRCPEVANHSSAENVLTGTHTDQLEQVTLPPFGLAIYKIALR